MKYTIAAAVAAITLLFVTSGVVSAQGEPGDEVTGQFDVDIYAGPKECEEEDMVRSGKFATIHFTGSIHSSSKTGEQGKIFDSSHDRGKALEILIGADQVFKDWDMLLQNLCRGAKANIVIPPEMGYGEEGDGSNHYEEIPGGATLNFDVEIVGVSDYASREEL